MKKEPEVVELEIDEQKMDRLLHLLHEADPQSNVTDTQEMLDLEGNNHFLILKFLRKILCKYIKLVFFFFFFLNYRTSYRNGATNRCSIGEG